MIVDEVTAEQIRKRNERRQTEADHRKLEARRRIEDLKELKRINKEFEY